MLLKNSMVFAATIVLKGALSFILIATFTRLLTADTYGDYAIVIVLVNFADFFGFMWLRHAVMRHITDDETIDASTYFANSFIIYGGLGLFCILASWVLAALGIINTASGHLVYELIGIIIATEAISNIAILMARLRLKLKFFFVLSILKPLLALGFGSFLITSGYGVQGAVWGLLVSCASVSVLGLIALPDFRKIKPSLINAQTMKAILTYGLPLVAVLSIQSAVKATDRILLETLIGGDITGLYAAAQDIPYKLLIILISAIHLASYPLIIKAHENKQVDACRDQLKITCTLIAGILLPATVVIGMLAPQLSYIFLGEEFRPFANRYFGIFAGISALNCAIQYYFILSFNLAKKTKLMLLPFCAALAINAGVGFYLIPIMAEQGAIWGSFLSYTFLMVTSIAIGSRIFLLPFPTRDLLKIAASTAVMGGALWLADFGVGILPLLIYTAIGGSVYVLSLLILNPLNLRQYAMKAIKK